jgi:dolichol-phosphate mannosyltransferase
MRDGGLVVRDDPLALSFVIPTRNESENVRPLLSSICEAVPGSHKEVIFVDDSDDDTPAILQRAIRESDCRGAVLRRSQLTRSGGLATAVVRGFELARGSFVCTMDADLQHPASAVPMMLTAAHDTAADVIVGSRYIDGLTLNGFDGAGRFAVSAVARQFARVALPPARLTSDPLSGFFLVRRSVIEGRPLQPLGYKILLEVLVRGRWTKITDVAYSFHSRNAGVSKATMREGRLFLRHLRLLRTALGAQQRTDSVPPEFRNAQGTAGAPQAAGEELFVAYGQRYDPLVATLKSESPNER